MVRISIVSYLNSKPFLYGLKHFGFSENIEIVEDIPSVCADKLITGKADIGLVPVAALSSIPNCEIIGDYCIGADGDVKSVLLLSEVPIEEISTVLLDYQSRTSIMLTKILFSEYWKSSPVFVPASIGYENKISERTAALVIGDRALELQNKFKYKYDLSAEWKKMTSLPFVFACWVSTKKMSTNFIDEFNSALLKGLNNIDKVAGMEQLNFISSEEIQLYLKKNIQFSFDEKKKKALELFLQYVESKQFA